MIVAQTIVSTMQVERQGGFERDLGVRYYRHSVDGWIW